MAGLCAFWRFKGSRGSDLKGSRALAATRTYAGVRHTVTALNWTCCVHARSRNKHRHKHSTRNSTNLKHGLLWVQQNAAQLRNRCAGRQRWRWVHAVVRRLLIIINSLFRCRCRCCSCISSTC